ncbi:MAG: GNAT family N-acetyltransferase [Propioniciclava sp.]|uniref:GNAT family N-acetyltransferase n=1 Tax=Propioniciclava sp. TaxID=2038686 RepID=UPI0039E66F6D
MPTAWTIAPLTADDVVEAVRAHIALQLVSYAHLADADHSRILWESYDRRVAELTADLTEADAARAAGEQPRTSHWVARGTHGAVVGLALTQRGTPDWERDSLGDAWTHPGVDWLLDGLYVIPEARGQRLGTRLLDAALPGNRGAYLWVITGNERAAEFYRRHGFDFDGTTSNTGEHWGHLGMRRMVRPDGRPSA